jgi:hypothetical protein
MNLLPKDDSFFFLFERHSQILCRAAKLLISGLADGYDGVCRIERDMSRIETKGTALSTTSSDTSDQPS